jgi:hypothetical protein
MQTFKDRTVYYFRSDATALGGFLKEPLHKNIPTLASTSLPAVGGFATARSGAFNLDEVVSFSSAYSLVTGRETEETGTLSDGSISTLTTSVVENLNILQVVTVERVVAQVSVTVPKGAGQRRVSFAGSRFEGLQLAGRKRDPKMNMELHQPGASKGGQELPLTWQTIQKAGQSQAERLIKGLEGGSPDVNQWAKIRYEWMTKSAAVQPSPGDPLLCSLVDGFQDTEAVATEADGHPGHIVEIPGFGTIILGELLVTRDSVQLVSIRAELVGPIVGTLTAATATANVSGGGGQGNKDAPPPC